MHADTPPPGRSMRLAEWARRVTVRVRTLIPDVRGVSRDGGIVWTNGRRMATLAVAGTEWWVKITSTTGSGTGVSTHSDRHDEHTAEVTAANIVIHFDVRYCRGLDVPPYTDHELKIIQGK